MKWRGVHNQLLTFTLAAGLLLFYAAGPVNADPVPPWTVFTPADSSLPMSPNSLRNAGFENDPPGSADDWWAYGSGYTVDETGGRGGGRALQLINLVATDTHGAYQRIDLDQAEPKPLYFSAWSKAENVSGDVNSDYSFYLDVYYTDGTPLWGQVLRFDTGSHDWQFREGFVAPAKPIGSVYAYCLLRRTHTGTAWFDDLTVQEVQAGIVTFDSVQVATNPPDPPPFGGTPLTLTTGDGLSLTLAADGGAITDLALDGTPVHDPNRAYASGFFARDVLNQSDFLHVGGSLTQTGNTIDHHGEITPLSLGFTATYTATADRIAIHAELSDTSESDRALTLYFALPIALTPPAPLSQNWERGVPKAGGEGWIWGDDIRTSREVTGVTEFANFYWHTDLGANGYLSKYPWASLSGPAGGIALGIPLDRLRVFRLVHNPATNQFYAAFDLGLSPLTAKPVLNEVNGFPSRASVDLVLYRLDEEWGFRAAAQGYYDRFPDAFTRRVPPGQEGIWVAFSDLSPITDIADFGIAFHELGSLSQVDFDDSAGILSFRYIAEPWSHWLPINDPGVDPDDYDQVMAYLHDRHENGAEWERDWAEATLSSGFFDQDGRYRYESTVAPWCSGVAGCAVFTLNPDPDVSNPTYPLNKAHLEWGQADRDTYTTTPGLDGEYVDSFLSRATVFDFREAHFAATDTPLTYSNADQRLGVPEVFATTEFARWLTQDVHQGLGKWTMANGILADLPWGADLFDFMGQEVDWLRTGSFVPDSDARMNYRRTLSYQRPYGLLMNTDFDNLSYELVERYFQICLFYGIYPSMFSHNAATERYWDDPSLYNRDRPLFRRYIPLIRRLNAAGWQPVTQARTSDPAVYIERFGDWPRLHFTLRNTLEVTVTVGITMEAEALGLPAVPITATALLADEQYPLNAPGPTRTLTVALAPQAGELLCLTWIPADLDGNCDVDIVDIMLVASRWHTAVGDPDYDPIYDVDGNGYIDVADIMLVAVHWGETC